jgi:hypothetical protein
MNPGLEMHKRTPGLISERHLNRTFTSPSGHPQYATRMARSRNTGVFIALAVFVIVAAVIRFYGEPIYQALLRLHGPGPGGH